MEKRQTLSGFAIVIAERGWVFVGHCEIDEAWCVVKDARVVRRWGTTRGIGQLAESGPTGKTKLDDGGTIRIPLTSLVAALDTEVSKWE